MCGPIKLKAHQISSIWTKVKQILKIFNSLLKVANTISLLNFPQVATKVKTRSLESLSQAAVRKI